MSAQILEFPSRRSIDRDGTDQSASATASVNLRFVQQSAPSVLILPVVRIERGEPDFSVPVATSAELLPKSWTLAEKMLDAEQRFPESRQAGLEDGLAGTWRIRERAAAMPQFNILAYTAGFAEGQLSIALVPA